MRSGGSTQKGAQFERTVAQTLSLWVSAGQSKGLVLAFGRLRCKGYARRRERPHAR